MRQIIEVRPERATPRGGRVGPFYLAAFNYPGLLSGRRVTVTVTARPADALAYDTRDGIAAALALLASLDYTDARAIDPEAL